MIDRLLNNLFFYSLRKLCQYILYWLINKNIIEFDIKIYCITYLGGIMKLILINPLKVINYSYIKLEYDNFKSTQNNTKKT